MIDIPKNIESEVYHMGKVPKNDGIFGVMDAIWDRMDTVLHDALSILLRRYEGEQKIKQALERIDFDYLEQILKKIVKNSAVATNTEFQDFKFTKDSVTLDRNIKGEAVSSVSQGYLKVNHAYLGKWAKEFSDDNLTLAVTESVAHEAIHLLAGKENYESGFRQEDTSFTSANEAMTEILARAVTSAYGDFTTTSEREGWLHFVHYEEDIKYLLALMAIVARDNQTSINSVIQAFTCSFFCGNSVSDSLSQFSNISKEAKDILDKLKEKKGTKSTFDITQFNFDPETKSLIEDTIVGKRRNKVVLSALHV